MKKPTEYNINPPRGQALLNFQGRRMPDKIELYETKLVEEVRASKNGQQKIKQETELNADFRNLLIHGDCLSACAYLISKNIKVDLVYIDPPYASGANYAKQIYLRRGMGKTQIENDNQNIGEEVMYGDIWQKEDYLNWLYERLMAIREIMQPHASIYVQVDWHIGHYVKLLLDEVFGEENMQREIIWRIGWVSGYKSVADNWIRNHDTIFYYTKNAEPENRVFNKIYIPYPPDYERWGGREKGQGLPVEDVWGVFPQEGVTSLQVVSFSSEDRNYTTQKPEGLLKRIIIASSNPGMVVADFFAGSGTALISAHENNRKYIGCDIGPNAIQTMRDDLVKIKSDFDILKINDGVRLFRNPAQTQAKIFSIMAGFKSRTELDLGEFWDGGLMGKKSSYVPVKFIGLDKKLTKHLVDVLIEEIIQLEDTGAETETVHIIYAHKEIDIDQEYVDKALRHSGKSTIKIKLISLNELLGQKADMLYGEENAQVSLKKAGEGFKVEIKKYFSSYLNKKIENYNAKREMTYRKKLAKQLDIKDPQDEKVGKKINSQDSEYKPVQISNNGLELIESVQFDTTLKGEVWHSNLDLEDKAEIKSKIKGVYHLKTDKFKIKIRNIAGDELIIDGETLK